MIKAYTRGLCLGIALLLSLLGCTPEPSFTLELSSLDLSLELGVSQPLNLTATRINLASSVPILVVLESPKQGFEAEPVTIKESGTASLNINPATVNTGTYKLTLSASTSEPAITRSLSFEVTVTPPAEAAALTLQTTDKLSLSQGASEPLSVKVTRYNLSGAVTVAAANLPAGVTVPPITLAPNESNGSLSVQASSSAQTGVSDIRLTASAADVSTNNTLELTITQATTSENVVIEDYLTGLEIPWSMAFSTDGTLYVTELRGGLKRYKDGAQTEISHSLNVATDANEGGLMGLALAPNFDSNGRIYLCYSYRSDGTLFNRVSYATLTADTLVNESIVLDAIPGGITHNGCRLAFAPGGTLYISTGDTTNESLPQATDSLAGKVLRLNADGTIPDTNPFTNPVWTYGHLNPQGLVFHPNGKLYASENGNPDNDEINLIERGRNYGWPNVAGNCDSSSETDFCRTKDVREPLTVYTPALGISNIVAYEGELFPELKDALIFVTLDTGEAHVLRLDDTGNSIVSDTLLDVGNAVTGAIDGDYGRLRDIALGPDGSIYLATSNQDSRGKTPFNTQADRIIVITKR